MGELYNKFDFKAGDMILYNYLDTDNEYTKGRIISISGKKAKIEIGVCHRKSEEIYKDSFEVNIKDLYPINFKFDK